MGAHPSRGAGFEQLPGTDKQTGLEGGKTKMENSYGAGKDRGIGRWKTTRYEEENGEKQRGRGMAGGGGPDTVDLQLAGTNGTSMGSWV